MDTSIGQGSDISKYIQDDIKCEFLFGLDLNSVNEACKRFTQLNLVKRPDTIFIQYDTSKNIESRTGLTTATKMIMIFFKYNKYII